MRTPIVKCTTCTRFFVLLCFAAVMAVSCQITHQESKSDFDPFVSPTDTATLRQYLDFWCFDYYVAEYDDEREEFLISAKEITWDGNLKDLTHAPLNGVWLWLTNTEVKDLTLLENVGLRGLSLEGSSVQDLTPLKGQKDLTTITLDPGAITNGLEVLRSLPSLELINKMRRDEFWRRWDAGERNIGVEKLKGFQPVRAIPYVRG